MTVREIADLAEVSPATVSRVFSHHPNIKPQVRDRVLKIAKEHKYHPRLPSKQRNVIIMLPEKEMYPIRNCLEMVMLALTVTLPKRGFRIEVIAADNLDRLESIQFCGAVAIGAEPEMFQDWGRRFTSSLVLIDRDVPPNAKNVFSVRSDEHQGMKLAIDHLYERGCRKIGCIIHGESGSGNTDVRRTAVINACKAKDLVITDSLLQSCADDSRYVEIIGKLLKQGIDGLFCPGGNAGIVAAYGLSLFSKHVPDEVSLIASENKMFSRFATPSQTTITQDHIQLAETAVDIIEAFPDTSKHPKTSVFDYSLIVRDSVAPLQS
tara:strand:- start:419 stop:1384 length:966 start_codon:yes stop_codon:yes gene_type:complete